MKRLFFVGCFALLSSNLFGQSGNFEVYTDTLGAYYASSIVECSNKSLFLGGGSYSSLNMQDCFICLYDSTGQLLWADSIASPASDGISAMTQLNDSVIVACALWNSVTAYNNELRLIWFDLQGNIIHSVISNVGNGGSECRRLIKASNGDLVMTGFAVDASTTLPSTVFIRRMDQMGNVIWTKFWGFGNGMNAHAITETLDGGFVIAGNLDSLGLPKQYILKCSASGDSLWCRTWGQSEYSMAYAITQSADGSLFVGSNGYYTGLHYQIETTKFDSSGQIFWNKVMGDQRENIVKDIALVNDSEVAIIGTYADLDSAYQVFFAKLSSSGDTSWIITLGGIGTDLIIRGLISGNTDYIGVGYTGSFTTLASLYLIKYTTYGVHTNIINSGELQSPFLFYPNPASESFRILLPPTQINTACKLKILNSLGVTVHYVTLPPGSCPKVDCSDLPPGWYTVVVEGKDAYIASQRLVVVR
ncbi:MAG: T9SS type A sorting domain-containing protein [Candidatus Pollutiaquabacter aromativorans]